MNTTDHQQKDQMLWNAAKKRAGFKWSLLSYIVINAFLTVCWALGDRGYFWPMWCMIGWGIGMIFQYFDAYHRRGIFSAEKEYEKLREQGK